VESHCYEELAKLRTPPDNGSLDIAVTTNGHILESQADELKAAGLTRLTVSMDAVDSDRILPCNHARSPSSADKPLSHSEEWARAKLNTDRGRFLH